LKDLIQENIATFEDKYNLFILFLLREDIKQKKSYFYDMIALRSNLSSFVSWTIKDITAIADPYLRKNCAEMLKIIDANILVLKKIVKRYPKLFPFEILKEKYIWAHIYV